MDDIEMSDFEVQEYESQRAEDHDIYTEHGLEAQSDDDSLSVEEQGFMAGYLAA